MSKRAKQLLIVVLLLMFYVNYLSVGVSNCGPNCGTLLLGEVSSDFLAVLWRWAMFIGVGLVIWLGIALFDRDEEEG